VASATRTVVVGPWRERPPCCAGINLGLDAKAMFRAGKSRRTPSFRLLAGVEERIACEAVVAAQD